MFRHCLLRLILLLVTVPAAFAQQAVTSATLTGWVEDASAGRVPGARVTVTSADTNRTWNAVSDDQGRFRFSYLPVGAYRLRAEREGFAPLSQELTLTVGQAVEVPLRLAVAGSSETVLVTAEAPAVETARTQLTQTIAPREIQNLPLNGRNFLDLALLSPAVSRHYQTNTDKFAETSAVPGTGISIAGKRNLNTGFVVDGLSANDDAADLAGAFYAEQTIREFQVVTSGGIAEFGRASGGTVNVLTYSGTNDWRGRVYGFLRNQRFDGTNIFASLDPVTGKRRKDALTQTQYGLTLGGPPRRDRLFLFSNFEQERLNRAGFVTIAPANANTINAELARIGFTSSTVETGSYPTGYDRTSYFAKSDYNLNDSHRLSLRYNFYDIFSPNARSVGALNAPSRGTQTVARDNNIAVSELATLAVNATNEIRFQFTRSRLNADGNDLIGPAVSISGVANFGASTTSPTQRDIDLIEVADNYSIQTGSHMLKLGANFLYNRVNIVFPSTLFGSYTFQNLPNFLAGTYQTYAQAFGKIDWFQTNPNIGWFIQDEWKVRSDLTINAGLRHDVQWIVDPVETRWLNFSPRIGIAYSPGDRKTVIRSGFGLYFDRVPLRAVANALRGDGTLYKAVNVQRGQVGAPAWPAKMTAIPPGVLLSLSLIDPEIKNESGIQTNLQVEREVLRGTSVSVGYQYLRGTHIIMNRNGNVPGCTAAVDPVNLCRPDSSFANVTQYSGRGDSYYSGMTLSVQHRASNWLSGRFSYTWAKAIDNTGNAFFSSPLDNFNLRADRALSDNDQRHRFTLSGLLSVPRSASESLLRRVASGFQLSSIFTYSSPYPFNPVSGTQTIQTTAARPCYVAVPAGSFCPAGSMAGRNTGVGFNFATLDLRVSRTVTLTERWNIEAMVEGFNVLNRTNYLNPNTTFGAGTFPASPNATYGQPQATFDPRQIQLGLRVNF